jgi:rhamnosyltransferase
MTSPEIIESFVAPLSPALVWSQPVSSLARTTDLSVTFLAEDGSPHPVTVTRRKGNHLELAIGRELLLREGALVVSSPEGATLFRIPWKPGQALLSKPSPLSSTELQYFREVELRHPHLAQREPCEVTFVILAKNEGSFLARTLQAIKAQDGLISYEILVIDSGSKDDTIEIALKESVRLIEIPATEFGHGRTRNLGAYLARGEYVCFLNADAVPMDSHWFGYLKRHFADPTVKGCCSRQVTRKDCDPLRKGELLNWPIPADDTNPKIMHIESLVDYLLMRPMEKRPLICFETVSCLVRRSDIVANPFPHTSFGEDFMWAKYMLENGARLVFEPLSRTEHSHDLYRSALVAMRKSFDDHRLLCKTIGPVMQPGVWGILWHLAFYLVHYWKLVINDDLPLKSKMGWILWTPFVTTFKIIGMALARSTIADTDYGKNLLSLVAHIKAQ